MGVGGRGYVGGRWISQGGGVVCHAEGPPVTLGGPPVTLSEVEEGVIGAGLLAGILGSSATLGMT